MSIISSLLWISHLWLDGTFHTSSLPLSLTIVCMETDISFLHYRTCGSPSVGTCALNWQRKDCILLKNLKALTTYLLQTLLSDGAELLVSCVSVEALKSLWRALGNSFLLRHLGHSLSMQFFLCPHSITCSLKYPCQHPSLISAFSPPSPTILCLDSASLM